MYHEVSYIQTIENLKSSNTKRNKSTEEYNSATLDCQPLQRDKVRKSHCKCFTRTSLFCLIHFYLKTKILDLKKPLAL